MIKLITQFDNEKTRLSLATPTCGGCCCCCCCCCVVSTFAAASVSARNFGNYVEEQLPNEPKKIKHARRFGFWFPLGLLTSLGIGLWLAARSEINAIIALIISIAYLFIVTSSLKKRLNLPGITSRVIGFSILLGIFEVVGLFVGMFALVYLGWFYLAGAVIISILLICWAFGKKYDDLENKNNISNNNSNNIPNNQSYENKNKDDEK